MFLCAHIKCPYVDKRVFSFWVGPLRNVICSARFRRRAGHLLSWANPPWQGACTNGSAYSALGGCSPDSSARRPSPSVSVARSTLASHAQATPVIPVALIPVDPSAAHMGTGSTCVQMNMIPMSQARCGARLCAERTSVHARARPTPPSMPIRGSLASPRPRRWRRLPNRAWQHGRSKSHGSRPNPTPPHLRAPVSDHPSRIHTRDAPHSSYLAMRAGDKDNTGRSLSRQKRHASLIEHRRRQMTRSSLWRRRIHSRNA